LLPPHVQERIGQVGAETRGVEKMLREIGFSYAHRIDPFDGGPHFQARTDDITLCRATRTARVVDAASTSAAAPAAVLVARERPAPPYFLAVRALLPPPVPGADGQEMLALPAETRQALDVSAGDEVAVLPLA
jgi:arginine N-succinyltransferase